MANTEVISNQKCFVATVLVLGPWIVLQAEGYSNQVFDSTHRGVIVSLIEVIEADHTIGTSSY